MEQTPSPVARRQVLAIKLPSSLQERMMCLPVIHLLRDAYPEADIHFISPNHKIEMLFALPFEAYWHPWNDDEIKTVFDVHRFAATQHLPDVDIYFSLGDNFNDLILGKFLGAQKRVGFAEGWKSWFMTSFVKRPTGHHLSEDFFALFKHFTNRRIPEKMQVRGKELPPFYPEEEGPYIAIDLWPFSPGKIDEFWTEYFALHDGKRFVLFFSGDEAMGAILADQWIQRLSPRNRYELFLNPNWIELGKMLAHAKGLVARAGASVSYATYLGTDALIIYETGEPRRDAPIPFYANWQILDLRDPTSSQKLPVPGILKPRPQVSPDVLFQKTSEMFYF